MFHFGIAIPFLIPFLYTVDDPCDVAPCANGGTCNRTGLTDFSCACDGNWGGTVCDGEIATSSAILFWYY